MFIEAQQRDKLDRQMTRGRLLVREALALQETQGAARLRQAAAEFQTALAEQLKIWRGNPSGIDDFKAWLIAALARFAKVMQSVALATERAGIKVGQVNAQILLNNAGIETFSVDTLETLRNTINLANSNAFKETLDNYPNYYANQAEKIMQEGQAQEKSPRLIEQLLKAVLTLAVGAEALRIIRTVQIEAARRALQFIFRRNADKVQGWVWTSSRDARTCPSCWALHGRIFSLDVPCNDHHAGRCVPVPVTNRDIAIAATSGETFFKRLPVADQRNILGAARYQAWRDGLFPFEALSETYANPTYGEMRREVSLKKLIGAPAASRYIEAARAG